MLHVLGIPTWFMTLSAANLYWSEMIEAVGTQTGKEVMRKDVRKLSIKERSDILKSNPVTLVDMLQYRVECLFHKYIHSQSKPGGEISDFIIKMKFQVWGSPHAHCLLWVRNAPHVDVDDDDTICSFIDRYISGMIPADTLDNRHIAKLVRQYETHAHLYYCCRNYSCRFGFPKVSFSMYIDL